jgi:hypothetical protein
VDLKLFQSKTVIKPGMVAHNYNSALRRLKRLMSILNFILSFLHLLACVYSYFSSPLLMPLGGI